MAAVASPGGDRPGTRWITVTIKDENKPAGWEEEYEILTTTDPQRWGEKLVADFNASINPPRRPGPPRELVSVRPGRMEQLGNG